MVRLFDELDNPPEWVDFDQLLRGSIAYFRPGPRVSFALTCSCRRVPVPPARAPPRHVAQLRDLGPALWQRLG